MVDFHYDPWQDARGRAVPVCYGDTGPFAGVTNGEHVWLHPDLTTVEQRCTLAHELTHITAGHTGHQHPETERTIRHSTARRLLPFTRLCTYRESQEDPYDIAEELGVTYGVLADRIRAMTDPERWYLYTGTYPDTSPPPPSP